MKARPRQPWVIAVQLFVAASLLALGVVSCAETNSGGCNACPQGGAQSISAEECQAAGKAAGCETAELNQHDGTAAGGQACGAGTAYVSCDWTNCSGAVALKCGL